MNAVFSPGAPPQTLSTKGDLLLFSYAFPPMQTQMTPAVYKPMAALARSGYSVDVVCADSFCKELPLDYSLMPAAQRTFRSITRISPSLNLISRLCNATPRMAQMPDLMTVLQESAYATLMDMPLDRYIAIITWSPFHSINPVMIKVKKARRNLRWIAQFSDPWADNPLECSRMRLLWNKLKQPQTIKAADFIIHSSRYSLELMFKNERPSARRKTAVIPHAYDDNLYPEYPKRENEKITLRYVGTLFGRRSPEPLFHALAVLFDRYPEWRSKISLELIGFTPADMLQTSAARQLPDGTVISIPSVSFLESLEKMHNADILVLIEADVRQNLFLPSKLSDYMGARTPIVGLVPLGSSRDLLQHLGGWYANPCDIPGIVRALVSAIKYITSSPADQWCDEGYRQEFSGIQIAKRFSDVIAQL